MPVAATARTITTKPPHAGTLCNTLGRAPTGTRLEIQPLQGSFYRFTSGPKAYARRRQMAAVEGGWRMADMGSVQPKRCAPRRHVCWRTAEAGRMSSKEPKSHYREATNQMNDQALRCCIYIIHTGNGTGTGTWTGYDGSFDAVIPGSAWRGMRVIVHNNQRTSF